MTNRGDAGSCNDSVCVEEEGIPGMWRHWPVGGLHLAYSSLAAVVISFPALLVCTRPEQRVMKLSAILYIGEGDVPEFFYHVRNRQPSALAILNLVRTMRFSRADKTIGVATLSLLLG